ncbi:hypothetical protein A3D71_00650 [Candidatus Kaiserbacteria bacterium RIFCSPHIGHO2_02_FULL_55_20]|uniref:Uncharacterized protein n=1 Tax=Candidatus Kaiserbacteria bacterium RIFCSPHIGHO2_02_FULL_55_20 TaxID=1798497 RepID=A0A1F6DWQ5_9BACT|nr:MAG: hypothetical protein A2680_00780 [Candidatus Kaiserbacteria bacterium RIFCSPHIGHO2_01_FULL_55_37]OGG65865.1 MAG: hypothetical protein A3D71_00650 [Candidatus Kaiserbacteria bacterium RIFCSPHIGHO2_02_FULL_55_20]
MCGFLAVASINGLDDILIPIKDRNMNSKEYFEAEKALEGRYNALVKSSPQARIFRKALEEYFEALITVKGHAWCMDVQAERGKMTRLFLGACMNILALESKAGTIGSNKILILCSCGKDVVLGFLGGQYQDTYVGRCTCKKGWILRDLPAKLPF